jgi:chromosome partitioning protein
LCIANQKGGVGKTTTAINLAVGLAMGGYQTLLVDMDPQCNATGGIGCKPVGRHPLVELKPVRQSAIETSIDRLKLLPGSRSFIDVDRLASAGESQSEQVVSHLSNGTGSFDFVVVDCPPSLGALTRTALSSSTEVLMPIQCEYFAMEGLTQMIEVIRDVMLAKPGSLEFGGILLTMYDESLELAAEVEDQVRDFFGDIVFDTVIPRDVAVSESPSHGRSVLQYSPRSRGGRAYLELCMEVMDRD